MNLPRWCTATSTASRRGRCAGSVADHTLQTTGILHEAYLRIFHSEPVAFQDRAHFFAVATQQLRRVLLDYARKANSLKRGGGAVELSLLAARWRDTRA